MKFMWPMWAMPAVLTVTLFVTDSYLQSYAVCGLFTLLLLLLIPASDYAEMKKITGAGVGTMTLFVVFASLFWPVLLVFKAVEEKFKGDE